MSFASEHASAHSDVAAAGVAIVVTPNGTTVDASTGKVTSSAPAPVISAVAIQVKSPVGRYAALGLVQDVQVTLFVVTDTYGDVIPLGASIVWAGRTFAVKDLDPFQPDGVPIFTRVGLGA